MAKQKTIKLELTEAELDTLFVGLDLACDNTKDEVDFVYFEKMMAKIKTAQQKLIKETANG